MFVGGLGNCLFLTLEVFRALCKFAQLGCKLSSGFGRKSYLRCSRKNDHPTNGIDFQIGIGFDSDHDAILQARTYKRNGPLVLAHAGGNP